MKKVCIYTNHYNPEQFKLNDITHELVNQGYDVKVITQTPNYPSGSFFEGYGWFKRRKEVLDDHLEVVRLPVIPRGNNSIMLLLNYISYVISSFFYSAFTRDKADAVLIYSTSPIFIAWAGLRFAKRRKISATLYLLDLWPGNLFAMFHIPSKAIRTMIEKMCIKIYNRTDSIMITSKLFREVLVGYGVDDKKISYLPQHAEFDASVWQRPQDDGVLKIIFTGNIGQAQGLDILVDVASELKQEGIHAVRFSILGDGRYKQTLQDKVKTQDVEDYFVFLGSVPRAEVPSYLNKNDFGFVSLKQDPVISRTLPAKVQSYMASGIPILASGDGEAAHVIEEAQCGFCARANDPLDLKRVIQSCLNLESASLAVMGKNGYTYSRKHFDLKHLTRELMRKL